MREYWLPEGCRGARVLAAGGLPRVGRVELNKGRGARECSKNVPTFQKPAWINLVANSICFAEVQIQPPGGPLVGLFSMQSFGPYSIRCIFITSKATNVRLERFRTYYKVDYLHEYTNSSHRAANQSAASIAPASPPD